MTARRCRCSGGLIIRQHEVSRPGFETSAPVSNRNVSVGSNKVILLLMHGYSGEVDPHLLFTITVILENDFKYHILYVIVRSTDILEEEKTHLNNQSLFHHYLILFI